MFVFILRDGLFIAAAVFFGQLDFQCKNESKRMFHDGTHDEAHAMLFVKWPIYVSMLESVES